MKMQVNKINPQYSYNKLPIKRENNSPAFKANFTEPLVNGLSKFYDKVADSNVFKNGIKKFSNTDKSFLILMVMESCFLSGFYMINTIRNKKIKKEQKPQMLINDAMTLGVSSVGACLVDNKVTNLVNKGAEKFFAKNKDFYIQLGQKAENLPKQELMAKMAEAADSSSEALKQGVDDVTEMIGSHLKGIVGEEGQLKAFQISKDHLANIQNKVKDCFIGSYNPEKAKQASKLIDDAYDNLAAKNITNDIRSGINKLKVLVVLGLIYRYLSPVVITPIANKLSSKFFDKKNENKKMSEKTLK